MVNLSQKLKELRKTGKISSKYTIFIYPLFSKVILRGPVRPPIWRVKRKFLLKPVQNLYLGKVSERRLFSSFVFCGRTKKWQGGQFPARDKVNSHTENSAWNIKTSFHNCYGFAEFRSEHISQVVFIFISFGAECVINFIYGYSTWSWHVFSNSYISSWLGLQESIVRLCCIYLFFTTLYP